MGTRRHASGWAGHPQLGFERAGANEDLIRKKQVAQTTRGDYLSCALQIGRRGF
jgi:hypothetical protein